MDKHPALYDIRTTHASGARESVLVRPGVAGVAYRAALAKARATGAVVSVVVPAK